MVTIKFIVCTQKVKGMISFFLQCKETLVMQIQNTWLLEN